MPYWASHLVAAATTSPSSSCWMDEGNVQQQERRSLDPGEKIFDQGQAPECSGLWTSRNRWQ
eukprot:3744239-Heterocapsa_arctica.AAC.1